MIHTRLDLEAQEAGTLAPYAQLSSASRGRMRPEPDDHFRTAFSRDRDRIVHSSAYRRLGNKTQVFVTLEGEYYRTRLTHTEETTQIALTMARALGLNLDLTEAIARAHDLGHAPFGHAGEAVLAACTADDGGFEHNAQTLRIVDLLEREYPEFPGLNLTWEVREGIAKHGERPRITGSGIEAPFPQPSLEAQIADLADGIAYGCHDLDDGLAAGLLNWQIIQEVMPAWWEAIRTDVERLSAAMPADLSRRFVKRYLVNLLVRDAIEVTSERISVAAPHDTDAVRATPEPFAALSPSVAALRSSLHQFLTANLYRHYLVETMWAKAHRLLRSLFATFMDAPEQLPPGVRERIGLDGTPARVICDYIAEMTDRAAVREYRRLFEFDVQMLP